MPHEAGTSRVDTWPRSEGDHKELGEPQVLGSSTLGLGVGWGTRPAPWKAHQAIIVADMSPLGNQFLSTLSSGILTTAPAIGHCLLRVSDKETEGEGEVTCMKLLASEGLKVRGRERFQEGTLGVLKTSGSFFGCSNGRCCWRFPRALSVNNPCGAQRPVTVPQGSFACSQCR